MVNAHPSTTISCVAAKNVKVKNTAVKMTISLEYKIREFIVLNFFNHYLHTIRRHRIFN